MKKEITRDRINKKIGKEKENTYTDEEKIWSPSKFLSEQWTIRGKKKIGFSHDFRGKNMKKKETWKKKKKKGNLNTIKIRAYSKIMC